MADNMTKKELIDRAADEAEVSKADTEKVLNAILNTVQEALVEKKTVTLVGFGTFTTTERQARKGRNPQSGAEIEIPASTVAKFRPGKSLRDAVNKQFD